MKHNIHKNKYHYKSLFKKQTLVLLFISTQNTQALIQTHNIETPIHIYANHQSIDITRNILTITGNVVIQQNNIIIYADKAIINKKKTKHTITTYGNPSILYYSKNNKNQILITSSYILYNEKKNTVILQGQAYLKTNNNILQSNCLIYIIKKRYVETCNQRNDCTKTIITIDNIHSKKNVHNNISHNTTK
ncbi:lipopolysaccharide transport periplasmic protein LptA [Blochmannia endosymbiont of Polyrhachis (Hedomyrma) turneri]|uniref:lipopolysaccharide transport periplasmic protein LptA n=1 Tax=Blochmannia endosymbiont of Polyrhachis (Hedomyrma) turneri TaxID=1505596 RepID=UPI00061A59B1|nr:lipopolysaccharide transport periplasmic protein LptA [Blochmannia endosymbiont of Polyrhachis (Hedomyrma) turneri]AKC59637.1 Lipopolysaccharide export system protein lptA [Blochmannia endosymbiont of Polyrhachis (Hedomyrma) turneri]